MISDCGGYMERLKEQIEEEEEWERRPKKQAGPERWRLRLPGWLRYVAYLAVLVIAIGGMPCEQIRYISPPSPLHPAADPRDAMSLGFDKGNPLAPSLLLFVHGWPDNSKVWKAQLKGLCNDRDGPNRCVGVELPGFAPGARRPSGDGPDFDELSAMLVATTRQLVSGYSGSPPAVTAIGHDWGAWLVYMTEKANPGLFDKVVGLDVGPGPVARPHESETVWVGKLVTYQLVNLAMWQLGSWIPMIGPLVANFVLRSFCTFFMGLGTGAWTPTSWYERSYTQSYPYWHTWRHGSPDKALCFVKGYQAVHGVQESPRCPTLFMAATVGMNLHGKLWFDQINRKRESDGSSKAVLLHGCHHWLMAQQPHCAARVSLHIREFLAGQPGDDSTDEEVEPVDPAVASVQDSSWERSHVHDYDPTYHAKHTAHTEL